MHRLLIGYCVVLFVSCVSKQPETKKITVIYCPEINNKTSFNIPKEITGVFKSQNIDSVNYEIITDSKIKIINGDFDNPVEVPIFNSLSQMIFGTPNPIKTNELITSELHTIRFEKKNSRKPYDSEPSENQIFIFYNTKNIYQLESRKYYVNSSDQISKLISIHKNDKKNFYIFNSTPHVVTTLKPAPPRVPEPKYKSENTKPSPLTVTTKGPLSFRTPYLGIDKDGSGHVLTWNHPIKINQSINYKISFINNDTKDIFSETNLQNQKSFNITGLSKVNFLKRGEFPKRGVTVKITAELAGYTSVTDYRQLSFMYDRDDKLTIWNCYTR